MKADRVIGLIITVSYTFAVLVAIFPDSSGALQDAVTWFAWVLLCFALISYGLGSDTILDLSGGRTESYIRVVCITIQLIAFLSVGWWWTLIARCVTEMISVNQVHHARLDLLLRRRADAIRLKGKDTT